MTAPPLLQVRNLVKQFPVRGGLLRREVGRVHAVDGVSFDLAPGETLGVVGESGCGKSTTGRCILRLIEPTHGEVTFEGKSVTGAGKADLRALTRSMQIIFQDPYASLNPRMTVGAIIGEGLVIHGLAKSGRQIEQRAAELLTTVGLQPDHMRRYPHEFSGGQRQRIGIARALAVRPGMLVCDEAVAALDVSIQAQILNLFMDLRERLGLTYLFISHDLGVIEHVCDRVVVMYLGRIVESAAVGELFARPHHPYTRALLAEIPRLDLRRTRFAALAGEIPSPVNPPAGCHFHPRCPYAIARCRSEVPRLREVAPGHHSACHLDVGASAPAVPVTASS